MPDRLPRAASGPTPGTARWTVSVSAETDAAVRSHLAQRGRSAGDLSRFIEEAVRWRLFEQTLTEAQAGFSDLSPEETEALAAEAMAATRRSSPV